MFSLNLFGKYFSNLNLKTLRDRETIDRLKNHKKTTYGSFFQYFFSQCSIVYLGYKCSLYMI